MKKVFILLIAACALVLSACNGAAVSVQTYTVKFESNGGTQVNPQTINEGNKAVKPAADPTKEGYDFDGWYVDEKCWSEYTFTSPVTEDITLYANWKIKNFTIEFVSNGGSAILNKYAKYNEAAAAPAAPVKSGYDFAGWFTDSACTTAFSFETKIKQNYKLYAKWVEEGTSGGSSEGNGSGGEGQQNPTVNCTVSFQIIGTDKNGKTCSEKYIEKTVPQGQSVEKPADPVKACVVFDGWYLDSYCGLNFDFSRPINQSITLFGRWNDEENYLEEQRYFPPSSYTYPSLNEYPKFVSSTKDAPGPDQEGYAAGTPVNSGDGILTVTPQTNGLKVRVNFKADAALEQGSVYWRHANIVVKDKTTGIETCTRDVGIVFDGVNPDHSEIVFPFTENGKEYDVWMEHEGNQDYEHADWGRTNDKPATVTAIGGEGEFKLYCDNINYSVNYDGTRKIELKKFERIMPVVCKDITPAIKIRAESGTRWGNGEVCEKEENISLSGAVITIANTDLCSFLNGKDHLFLVINYIFAYEGLTFQQEVFANYEYWTNGEFVENWFADVPVDTSKTNKFPIIRIDTGIENGNCGSNNFVTEPVSHLVKDVMRDWDGSVENVPDPGYVNCDIYEKDPGAVEMKIPVVAQVKVRGNWTTTYDKKSLRIKFSTDDGYGLCGLNNGQWFKNWILISEFKDASLARDAVAYKMFKEMFRGYYASNSCFVELIVNGTYMGVYLLAEQQEVDSSRINITAPGEGSAATDIGYLLEFDTYYYTEKENERFEINYRGPIYDYYGDALVEPNKGYTIKSKINNVAQKNFITTYMNNLWRICYEAVNKDIYQVFDNDYKLKEYVPANENETAEQKRRNCVESVIDIDSLVNTYIFNEIICDPDLYYSSFYMDIDFGAGRDKKLRFEAPWDFDSTMGNKRFCIEDTTDSFNGGINGMFAGKCQPDVNGKNGGCGNPWMMLLIREPWFQQLVKAKWSSIDKTSLKSTLETSLATITANQYDDVFNYNRQIWGNPSSIEELCAASATAAAESHAASVEYFKDWLMDRIDAVDTIIQGL